MMRMAQAIRAWPVLEQTFVDIGPTLCRIGMDVVSIWELPIPEDAANLFTAAGLPVDGQSEQDRPSN
jgi:hypothetical protein